jgi:hypothetical protein
VVSARNIEDRLYDLLGNRRHPDDMTGPPMDGRKFYWGDPLKKEWGSMPGTYVASQTEDGSDLWFGHVDEWHFHMSLGTARRMAAWVLWQAVKDAFGLRTKLWYWLLHRKVSSYRP